MIVKKIINNEIDLCQLALLFFAEHCFQNLDDSRQSFWGIYKLFRAFENNEMDCYGVFEENNRLIGVCFGNLDDDNNFVVHLLFKRKVEVIKACLACENFMYNEYQTKGIKVKSIVGYIPVFNKGAIRLAMKLGYKKFESATKFIHNQVWVDCYKLQKKRGEV